MVTWRQHIPLVQCVNQFIEPRVANGVDRAHIFGNHVCDGIHYFFMPVGAGWICGGIVKCVLNWGLCGSGRSRGAFHFWVFCSFTTWSCITLCVDFKWLNKLVVFPWGVDTVVWHIFVCSSKPKCFNTTEFALPFFPTKGSISAIFNHLLLQIFSKHALAICTGMAESQNLQAGAEQSAQVEMQGFAAFTTQDTACGRMIVLLWLSCFHDRGKNQNRNWNSINRPALHLL